MDIQNLCVKMRQDALDAMKYLGFRFDESRPMPQVMISKLNKEQIMENMDKVWLGRVQLNAMGGQL